jgi:hypothetical protein
MAIRKSARNDEIVRRRNAGETYAMIAPTFGLTRRRVHHIYTAEMDRLVAQGGVVAVKPVSVPSPIVCTVAVSWQLPPPISNPAYTMPVSLRINALRAAAAYHR